MKKSILAIIISLSLVCNAQTDTVKTDSTWCLKTTHVVHGTALAFAIFYSAVSVGFAKGVKKVIKAHSNGE